MKKNTILKTSDHFNKYLSQPQLFASDGQITKMMENDFLPSMIFWGPSGSGKTQLIKFISNKIGQEVKFFHAAYSSKKDFETNIKDQDIIFIDEFHNLDKRKQDYIMYLLDEKDITLIGATTQNPYYSITPAMYSRMLIVKFNDISDQTMLDILNFHIENSEFWAPEIDIKINEETRYVLAAKSGGDIRKMLLSFELLVHSNVEEDMSVITKKMIEKQFANNVKVFESKESQKYNLLSAMQKSIRGSNVDASIYYLARLILLEDLVSILRRLRVIVYEDIGFGNLDLINRTVITLDMCEKIGLPEARIPLSLIVCEMALSPKDNSSYLAMKNAIEVCEQFPNADVHENIKHGTKTYKYPFDYENNIVLQPYLPKELENINLLKIKSSSNKAKAYEQRRVFLKKFFKR